MMDHNQIPPPEILEIEPEAVSPDQIQAAINDLDAEVSIIEFREEVAGHPLRELSYTPDSGIQDPPVMDPHEISPLFQQQQQEVMDEGCGLRDYRQDRHRVIDFIRRNHRDIRNCQEFILQNPSYLFHSLGLAQRLNDLLSEDAQWMQDQGQNQAELDMHNNNNDPQAA